MATLFEASQVRLSLKMKLCNFCWYKSSIVSIVSDGFGVSILVRRIDDQVRKTIPQVIDGVSVRTEL